VIYLIEVLFKIQKLVLKMLKWLTLFFLVTFSIIFVLFLEDKIISPGELPDLPEDCWKAAGKCEKLDKIEKFKLNVTKEQLNDLKLRIDSDLKRVVPPLKNSGFNFGFNSDYLKSLGEYWSQSYDWATQEKLINSFPQYKTRIDGLDIHFLHIIPSKSKNSKKILPLLLVHGWPGSFVEFLDIIPLLTSGNDDFAFEVIIPSIPGYGFSSAPEKPGFDAIYTAKIFRNLMMRLGHKKFYCQGGDWGSLVTTYLATFFPENVLGLHTNMAGVLTTGGQIKAYVAQIPGLKYLIADKSDFHKVDGFFQSLWYLLQESGYMHIQATKPDTVGVGLSSSPLGLAAYILEKFSTWTNKSWRELQDGGLESNHPISKDKMLTNVMIYWITNSITSSMRYYKENFSSLSQEVANTPIKVPTAFADFPEELMRVSRFQMKSKFPNLVQFSTLDAGGHFAAMEVPSILAKDIIKFVTIVEKQQKVKPGKDEI